MPVISCPKCPTKLRVPDGATGNTKCPKCNTIFPVVAPAGAFEVVDDAPPARSAPPPPPRPASPPPPPPPAKSDFEFDDDAPKKKRRRDDEDDDDDDRPRRRRRDDDDDDDRPRSRRRRDDDDDDDDRPRRRRGRRSRYADDDDDDDDRDDRGSGKKGAFGAAKTGVLLLNISFWLYFSTLALISLCIFLGWVGAFDGSSSSSSSSRSRSRYDDDDFGGGSGADTVVKLLGILGMSNWIVALVGLGFCIAGPARARGMAITATALSAAHLLLTGITFNNLGGGLIGQFSGGLGGGTWICWTSMMPFLDVFLPAVIYGKGMFTSDFVFAFLAAVCEVLRLIFTMLAVKQLSIAAKDYDSAEKAQFGVVAAAIIAGVSAIFVLLVVVLLDAGITKSLKAVMNIAAATLLLIYMGFTAMTVLPAIATNGARNSLGRRARRG